MGDSILIYLFLFLIVYFLPSIIAHVRDHKHKKYIFFLTLLTSWTFIGWIASFVWAVRKDSVIKKIKNLDTEAYLASGLVRNLLKLNNELKNREITEDEFELRKIEIIKTHTIQEQ